MILSDRLTLDAPRMTRDGYMAVRARAARTGIYDYLGSEVDPTGEHGFKATDTVRVYRDEAEVFAPSAVHSFLMKPITDEHPTEPVTADNWSQKAKGVVAGAMRDGDYLAFDLVMMDAGLIDAVKSGKRELSNGYQTDLDFTAGTTPSGMKYDARQTAITGNHVAVVKAGRAGSECRIADRAMLCDSADRDFILHLLDGDKNVATKTIVVDGISIEFTDQAAQAFEKIQGQVTKLTADLATANTTIGTLTADVSTKTGEITALNAKLKDAEVTPAKLQAMAETRSKLIDAAKLVLPTIDANGKTDAEIRKLVVDAKLSGHTLDENGIIGAFAALTATADPLAAAIRDHKPSADGAKRVADAHAEMVRSLTHPNEKKAA